MLWLTNVTLAGDINPFPFPIINLLFCPTMVVRGQFIAKYAKYAHICLLCCVVFRCQSNLVHNHQGCLITRFMGRHGALLGPTGPRWVPCLPHEFCYLGCFTGTGAIIPTLWCQWSNTKEYHYSDVILTAMASRITGVCSIICSSADKRKLQSSLLLAFLTGILSQRVGNAENVSVWWRHLGRKTNHVNAVKTVVSATAKQSKTKFCALDGYIIYASDTHLWINVVGCKNYSWSGTTLEVWDHKNQVAGKRSS